MSNQEWIKISDKLPELNQMVLVVDDSAGHHTFRYRYVAYLIKHENQLYWVRWVPPGQEEKMIKMGYLNINFWMPLLNFPEPIYPLIEHGA